MQTSSTGGIELQLSKRPEGDASRISSAKDAKKSLSKYSFLLVPGIFGGLLAWVIYPPLDAGPFVAVGMCVLFVPMTMQLWSKDVGRLRTAYVYSSLTLAMLAALFLLNGWLDRSPRSVVRTSVIQKTATRSRGGIQYVLTVSSWRPGRSTEDFYVSSREFSGAVVGRTVTVELHKGYFDLPWSGKISPK